MLLVYIFSLNEITTLTGILVIVTAWYAYSTSKQAKLMAEQTKYMLKERRTTAFIEISRLLQEEEIRKARRYLLDILSKKPYEKWTKETDKNEVEKVCYSYSLVGTLVSKELIDEDLIVEGWHNSIKECWEAAEPMVDEYRYREDCGPDFWKGFQDLNEKAISYEKEQKKKSES